MSVFHPIKAIQEYIDNSSYAWRIQEGLRNQNDKPSNVSVNNERVVVRYNAPDLGKEQENFFKIEFARNDLAHPVITVGYSDPEECVCTGDSVMVIPGDEHIIRKMEEPVTEEPYRSKVMLIRSSLEAALK